MKKNRLTTKHSFIRIGARASNLAQIQAKQVGTAIQNLHPDKKIHYSFFKSHGDLDLKTPIYNIDAKGIFTRDLTNRLLAKQVDLVVHSYKDLELQSHPKTTVLPLLDRGDPHDLLLVKKKYIAKQELIKRWKVHTSSLRRAYNFTVIREKILPLRFRKARFEIQSIRGNVSTRIRKLNRETEPGILIVAKAAVDRLLVDDSSEFIEVNKEMRYIMTQLAFMVLPLSLYPTAAGQGCLAAEFLSHNDSLWNIIRSLIKPASQNCVERERKMLQNFGGGCQQEIGITCLQKEYGMLTFIRGRTLQGESLGKQILDRNLPIPVMTKRDAFPLPIHKSQQTVRRSSIAIPAAMSGTENSEAGTENSMSGSKIPKHLYISRMQAIPEQWLEELQNNLDCIVGCPGIKTTMHLADKNIWVHGSAEGLGEHSFPELKELLGRTSSFIKLTHTGHFAMDDHYTKISTYELQVSGSVKLLENKRFFFWSSPSQFAYYQPHLPKTHSLVHSCGPGLTGKYLRSQYGLEPIIFLSYEDWLANLVD